MEVILLLLIFLVALTYSFVGHGGASGYLAILALFGFPPNKMVQSALILNILVSATALWSYARAGHFNPKIFWSFSLTSIPFAFIGGVLNIPDKFYNWLFSFALIFAAFRLILAGMEQEEKNINKYHSPRPSISFTIGAVIGLLSGIVGIGGGIFLSPLLILMRWADSKKTAGVSSAFILVNSLSGLLGHSLHKEINIIEIWPLVLIAFLGGLTGSNLGAFHAKPVALCRVLACVMIIAAIKMLL